MVQPLVQAANGVLLCLNLTAVVLYHCIAFMLQSLVLSLGLQELPLKLLELLSVWASASKRFGEISADWVATSDAPVVARFQS